MHKTPLCRIFRSLEKQERRQLRKLVRSPFFNHREDVIRLFDYLDRNIDRSERQLTKAKAFPKVFPDRSYDDGLLRHTMSFLLQKLREYLILTELNRSEFKRQLHLARSLHRRGLDDLFLRTLDQAERLVVDGPHQNANRHFNKYLIQNERYEAAIRQQRRGELGLQEQANEFAAYFAANLLRQACGIVTHQAMTKKEYDVPFLEEVLAKVEGGSFPDVPSVQLYFHAYRAQQSIENEQHFSTLTSLLESHWQLFPTEEARDLFLLAINFCIKKINSGEAVFRRNVFDLYRSGLEKKILLTGGVISPFTYGNVLNVSMLVDEFDWAADFLEQYKEMLPEGERENIYRFNLANFLFRKKQYGEAMDLLRHVEFKDKLHNLDARRLLLRMYFESGDEDALDSLLDSFETYIRRQKDLGYHGKSYINLIRFVRRLQSIPLSEKEALKKLKEEIESTPDLAERTWLLLMVEPKR